MTKSALVASVSALIFAAASLWTGVVSAQQSFPNHVVKLVAGYPPGRGADTQGRSLAEKLTGLWGQAVIVDNKPGGMGSISARAVARADPDGYTMDMGTFDHLVLGYNLTKEKAFDNQKD